MSTKILKILIYGTLSIILLFIIIGVYQKHFGPDFETYVEFQYSLYHIPNQCIADYYAEDLTSEGKVFSLQSIVEACNTNLITNLEVKIYNDDGKQQLKVKAYKLHGLMIKVSANACFMNRVLLRRVDNNKIVTDITKQARKMDEKDNIPKYSLGV